MYDFMNQLYYPEGVISQEEIQTGDFADSVTSIWDDFGLLSVVSRVLFGLCLMFLLALVLFGVMIANHMPVNVGAIVIIEVFFMILLVYLKLIPVWVLVILGLLGAGLGAYSFIMHTRNT
jgi:hypothetical protein